MLKKISAAMLLLTAMLVLGGCGLGGDKTAIADENGNKLVLTLDEIKDSGFYAYDTKGETFSPIMTEGTKDSTSIMSFIGGDKNETKSIWAGSSFADLMDIIPEVDGKTTRLVMFQNEEEEMPDEYIVEKYKYMGYTLGVQFTFGETGNKLFIDPSNVCQSSMAKKAFNGSSSELLPVHHVSGGKTELPIENIDTSINILLGLEKNKKYELGYYDGTVYKKKDMVADTVVFKYQDEVLLNDPLEPTESGYFYINLPPNMKNGYYSIKDAGIFKYVGQSGGGSITNENTEDVTGE